MCVCMYVCMHVCIYFVQTTGLHILPSPLLEQDPMQSQCPPKVRTPSPNPMCVSQCLTPCGRQVPDASLPSLTEQPGKEDLYFFGKNLRPRGAKAALVILFILGLLLLVATVILSLRLRSTRRQTAYREVQSCALPTDAL